ncbi:MAG: zinc-binding dehydrogenase, partial [Alphaproteobacteria bacterium]
ALGADHLINYTDKDFSREAWAISGKKGVNVLVNYTGGDTWVPSIRAMAPGGRLLCCGATNGYQTEIDLRYLWRREIDVRGSNGWRIEDLHALLGMMETGTLKAVIDEVYPLEETAEAMRRIEDREVFGKVIIKP